MMHTRYKSVKEMINKLQKLKVNTKLKFHQNFSHYDKMCYLKQNADFYFEIDAFSKDTQGITMIMHEAF